MTYLACNDGNERTGDIALSLVFPILVVPNETLWMTQYSNVGDRIRKPERVNRCSYFVNLPYTHLGGLTEDKMTISHIEFLTIKGLISFIDKISDDDKKISKYFPVEYIIKEYLDKQ